MSSRTRHITSPWLFETGRSDPVQYGRRFGIHSYPEHAIGNLTFDTLLRIPQIYSTTTFKDQILSSKTPKQQRSIV
jgi:hypothetical protein